MGELLAGEGGVVRGREEMSRCESPGDLLGPETDPNESHVKKVVLEHVCWPNRKKNGGRGEDNEDLDLIQSSEKGKEIKIFCRTIWQPMEIKKRESKVR